MVRPLHRLLLAVLIGVMLIGLAGAAPARAAHDEEPAPPPLFGSHEIRSDQLSLFPKWRGALARHFDESALPATPCRSATFNRCHLREWKGFLAALRGVDPLEQIRAVNRFLNERAYVIDPRNYGVPDYWATPSQFLALDGDCEDYAIAKYFSLRALGFAGEAMRIVVLQDLNLQTAHAILVVYVGGRALVLDNQVPAVVDARAIKHYRAIYSINEQHWWLHRL